ncbi:UNVERIFIED_ORG: hypothetical protein J2Y77_000748 [Pseudomonas lini]|uniref:Haemolysin XhlA n=1 Tax=Pseudomonas viciae TaxID=2505979 RepID=A0ABY8PJ19_9PSED|nr:hypothetical protein [Pseudomonas viciae]UZE88179.1 hypothetical protein LOY66_08850 [Pseudomonas viciae]WGO95159.1 hypothetical protein QCD61_08760 [Pseudomonas viciae]
MRSHEYRLSPRQFASFGSERADTQNECKSCSNPAGGIDLEPRVVELETHLKYIRKDMDEIRTDVKVIRHRLAYSAGAAAVVLGLLGWIANSRFDQLVTLLSR